MAFKLFAILQKYDFSSKSQRFFVGYNKSFSCLRYCKSTIFQANHNTKTSIPCMRLLFAILQKYDFSSKSQRNTPLCSYSPVVCDTAKVRFFKQITTQRHMFTAPVGLFAILQKYDFSSKSQPYLPKLKDGARCLRYCKSTIFQANHNLKIGILLV